MTKYKRYVSGIISLAFLISFLIIPSSAQTSSWKGSNFTSGILAERLDNIINYGISDRVSPAFPKLGDTFPRSQYTVQFYNSTRDNNGKWTGAECLAYAYAVYNQLFHWDTALKQSVSFSKDVKARNSISYELFQELGIRFGAYIRTTANSKGTYNMSKGHSMIVLSYDNTGITTLDAVATSNGNSYYSKIQTYTWDSFNESQLSGRGRYINNILQPPTSVYAELEATTPTPTYIITFNSNGGTVSQKTKTVTAGNEIGILPTPTRDGYTFLYWSTEKDSSGMVVSKDNLIVEKNQTLYAQWKKRGTPPSHEHIYVDDKCSICGTSLPGDNGFDNSAAGKYVVIADRAYVRTGPYQSKSEKYRLNRWDEISVVGSVVNSYGNIWLKTSDGYYTHADKLERVVEQPQKTEITFNGLTTPGNLTVGKGGHIDGSITSSNSPICSVRAEVCDSSGNVYLTASSSGFSRSTYGPIKDSRIDNKLTFGKLPAGDYYIKYTVTTEDNTTAFAKTSVFSVFSANNDDAVNGSSTTSVPGGNTSSSTLNYWNCNTIISCFNGQTVNLYNNPGDSSRVTYFSKGQTAKSTRGATLSDGSIWYSVTVNHNGTNKLLWLKYDGSKMSYTDISN